MNELKDGENNTEIKKAASRYGLAVFFYQKNSKRGRGQVDL
ncbi:hypothetical protein RV02_GL003275 [Enterococcus gilvus]|nr:hypothetical protein RV02_GL003275 [Enterococcus gilvus]